MTSAEDRRGDDRGGGAGGAAAATDPPAGAGTGGAAAGTGAGAPAGGPIGALPPREPSVTMVDSADGAPRGQAPEPDRPLTAAAAAVAAGVSPGVVFRWAVAATLGVLVVLAVSSAVFAVRGTLVLVVIALFVAVSLDPAVRWLIKHGVRRSVSVTLIFLALLLLIAGFVWSVVPPLVAQAGRLGSDVPGFFEQLPAKSGTYRELDARFGLTDRLADWASTLPARLGTGAMAFVGKLFGAVFNTLTVLVLTVYFMADLPRLRRGLVRLFPRPHRPRVAEVTNVVVDKVGGYMIGNLIISVFAGVSSFACLVALDVPYAVPLAFAVAITDLIPLIGAVLGAGVCVSVAFFTGDLWPTTIGVAIFFVLYQQLENYLIAPRVLRNTVDLSSVAILLAGLLGIGVLGVVGAIMAIPVAAAVKVILSPRLAALHEAPVEPVR